MNFTFAGFLKGYCRELSGQESLSFRKLVQLAQTEAPRVAEPMFMLALCQGKEGYLVNLAQGTWLEAQYKELVAMREHGETVEAFASRSDLPSRYANVWNAYRGKKEAAQKDRRLNGLMRAKTLEALRASGVTCYALCKQLGLNKGNVYAYLNGGDSSKVSYKTAQRIMNHALAQAE